MLAVCIVEYQAGNLLRFPAFLLPKNQKGAAILVGEK